MKGRGTGIGIGVVVALFALFVWHQRWLSDDGLIFTRTVRQLLAGNGPVFNSFERVEANTSTLWTYLLFIVAWITRLDTTLIAVILGGLLSVAGLAIALDGTRRLHRLRGTQGLLVPCGVFILLGATPFWDFATSGLETGLAMFWQAACWWLLVTVTTRRHDALAAFVFGLGVLVRPELALMTFVFGAAAYLITGPTKKQTFALLVIAFALPFAYEVFRAGYYGALVPMPALAKSATSAAWGRGWSYLKDFEKPYHLWIPVLVLGVLSVYTFKRVNRPTRIIVLAPIITGTLLVLFVLRVGGDFMHARMMLPPLFLMGLPLFLVPVRTFTVPAVAVLAIWALIIGIKLDDSRSHATSDVVEDERAGYARWTGRHHPINPYAFVHAELHAATQLYRHYFTGTHVVVNVDDPDHTMVINPENPHTSVYIDGRLGTGGLVTPLDAIVADTLGLANPLGARITATNAGFPGHEKPLPGSWLVAQFADPDTVWGPAPAADIKAARHAMTCGALAEMLASVHEPLTASRFFKNLIGSVGRTRLVIPASPLEAEAKFCR